MTLLFLLALPGLGTEAPSAESQRGGDGGLVARAFGLIELVNEVLGTDQVDVVVDFLDDDRAKANVALLSKRDTSREPSSSPSTRGLERRLEIFEDDDLTDDEPAALLYSTILDGSLFGRPPLVREEGATESILGVVYAEDGTAGRGHGPLGPARIGAMFFDGEGNQLGAVDLDGLGSFLDPGFRTPSLLIDEAGRATIVYADLPDGAPARVLAQRVDPVTGALIGDAILVADQAYAPSAALLGDDGDAAVVVYVAPPNVIQGVILDLSEPVRGTLGDPFAVSTSPSAFTHYLPAVAADRISGRFMVVWEDLSGEQFDPVNILGRRFAADGTPLDATDFRVNQNTSDAQSQASITAIEGLNAFVVTWTSDGTSANDLDIFGQIYDASGAPIGAGDLPLTDRNDVQDRSSVKSLGQRDSSNRPLISLTYRDVANAGGAPRSGESGASYQILAIEGLTEAIPPIFVDGFESGDTTSWTSSTS